MSKVLLQVEMWPVEKLVPYARNPRKNDAQVDRMAGALREFGFRIPIVAKSDGSVVDGHLRLKAAIKLGMSEVPVALADELTEAQVKAFRLLANKSVEWAEWDDDLLKIEMEELQALGFDLELTPCERGVGAPGGKPCAATLAKVPSHDRFRVEKGRWAAPVQNGLHRSAA